MAARRSGPDHERENDEILARLDLQAEYEALGIRFAGRARSSGMIECYARGRDEKRPSACVNLKTGRYIDKGGSQENLSLWDFAAQYGLFGGDWQAARRHYAEKAGVKLAGPKRDAKRRDDPLDSIELLDWTEARRNLVHVWCRKFKPGVSLDAILRAGGQFGEYPIWRDDAGNRTGGGQYRVIALPCWAEQLPPAPPVCWVLLNATGPHLPIHRGPDLPVEWCKMKTVGPSRGTLMNRHALDRLAGGADYELALKTGGPTDMLAVMTAQPPDLQDLHIVVTNASGEGGDVLRHQVECLRRRPVLVIHDQDTAGLVGRIKWLAALATSGHQNARAIRLPFELRPKGGQDARDFLNQEGAA